MGIEGADWDKDTKTLRLNYEIRVALSPVLFKWIRVEKDKRGYVADNEIMVPVYLNKSRKHLIFSVKMNCGDLSRTVLYQKGIALIAWN